MVCLVLLVGWANAFAARPEHVCIPLWVSLVFEDWFITQQVSAPGNWESPTRLQGTWLLIHNHLVLFELPWTICACLLEPVQKDVTVCDTWCCV